MQQHSWIIIGLVAVCLQTLRSGMMKHLRQSISDQAIIFIRFVVSLPMVLGALFVCRLLGYELPQINNKFIVYAFLAAFLQTIGGFFFLALFGRRNYVIGITYSKLEAIMAALFGALLFAELISAGAAFAIILGFVGIFLISVTEKHIEPQKLVRRIFSRSGMIGMTCGVLFGLCSVFIRQSILALEGGEFFTRALVALLVIVAIQAIWMFMLMLLRHKQEFLLIAREKKNLLLLGLSNGASSICWFTAFSLTKTAYVSMISQIEIIFSVFMTHNIFGEKINATEAMGILLVASSVLLLIIFG